MQIRIIKYSFFYLIACRRIYASVYIIRSKKLKKYNQYFKYPVGSSLQELHKLIIMYQKLSQFIAAQISKGLIQKIPQESLLKAFEKNRSTQIRKQSLTFMMNTFSEIDGVLNNMAQSQLAECNNYFDQQRQINFAKICQKKDRKYHKQCQSARRPSIQRSSRYSLLCRKSKLGMMNQAGSKGLVKLANEQSQNQVLSEYIQKLRQKKIRIAEAMGQFEKQQQSQDKIIQKQLTSRGNCIQSKSIITDYNGQIMKSDGKSVKKQIGFWLQRSKVKPIFRLKQPSVTTNKDLLKCKFDSQNFQNNCISDNIVNSMKFCDSSQKRQRNSGLNIKSIIDVFASRRTLQLHRSRRNAHVR